MSFAAGVTTAATTFDCSTGRVDDDGNCIAQDLADGLGVTVTASNDTFYVIEDGSMRVGDDGSGAFVSFRPRSVE